MAVPAFDGLYRIIIKELNKAINAIYVCMAWFIDDEFRDVLMENNGNVTAELKQKTANDNP